MTTELITRPRRRYLRFTLRGLLAFILVLGAWIGMIVRSARLQREAVTAIEKSGGTAHYNWTWNSGGPIAGGKPWAPPHITDLIGIDYFGHVTYVSVADATQTTIEHVGRLTQIQFLQFRDHATTVPDLASLQGLTQLTELDLGDIPLGDRELSYLRRMTRLSKLRIRGTHVTGSGLKYLKGMTELTELVLSDSQITGAGLQNLKGMTKLAYLNLGGANQRCGSGASE